MFEYQAREDFLSARRKSILREIVSFLRGHSNELLSWDEVKDELRIRGRVYRGFEEVPVDKIIGSVGRYQDFDRAFLPRTDDMEHRWKGIAGARYRQVSLPPIKLYKVGDAYFVLDGNHRVSVAKEQGVKTLRAEVIEARSRVPVDADLNADNLEIKGEYARFLERTQLDELRPDQDIEFTIGGAYERLLEHIAVHRYFMAVEQGRPVSEDEAVCDWYDNVYQPLVHVIREREVLEDFPGRTEADLYLWIIEHQYFLHQEYGDVEQDEAADHFADRYTSRPLKRIWHAVRRFFGGEGARKDLLRRGTQGAADPDGESGSSEE